MELTKVQKTIYKPVFNPDTGKYMDESPFKLHSRNNVIYTCLCNHSEFNTTTSFKSHIKSKSHSKYLLHYDLHVEDSQDAQSSSNDYQSKFELAQRKCKQLLERTNVLEAQISHHKFLNLILKYKLLNIDKLVKSDVLSTDQFEDCNDTIEESEEESVDDPNDETYVNSDHESDLQEASV